MSLDQPTGKEALTCKTERDKESLNGSQQSVKYPSKRVYTSDIKYYMNRSGKESAIKMDFQEGFCPLALMKEEAFYLQIHDVRFLRGIF